VNALHDFLSSRFSRACSALFAREEVPALIGDAKIRGSAEKETKVV